MSADLVILVPVLRRPQNVAPLLDSIAVATPDARVLFIADPDDADEIAELQSCGADFIAPGGNYARKINIGVAQTTEPLIFTGADDLEPLPGWFEAARGLMSDEIGVVGTNDMCNPRTMRGENSTHSLVARWYVDLGTVDEPGKLLHEGYDHSFCDDELVATAKSRGMFAMAFDAIVEHHHPMNDTAPDDVVYRLGREHFKSDRRLFRHRSGSWT